MGSFDLVWWEEGGRGKREERLKGRNGRREEGGEGKERGEERVNKRTS